MPDSFGKEKSGLFIGRPQEDDELFSSPTDNRVVWPAFLLETFTGSPQREVSEMMAVGVVNLFEMVDIEKEQGHRFVPPEAAGAFIMKNMGKIAAVIQAGQGIKR